MNLERFLTSCPPLFKLGRIANKVLISTFGLKVVPAWHLSVSSKWPDKLIYFQRLFNLIEAVPGDIVECGVASGGSLTILAILVRNSRVKRHIWGFDSFAGLPEASEEDFASPTALAKKGVRGMFPGSPEIVISNLKAVGFDSEAIEELVTLIKGSFSATLPKFKGSIALLHIDADLYNSYKLALANLWNQVTVGGVCAFDEHEHEQWPGAKKAIDEFIGGPRTDEMKLNYDDFFHRYYIIKE